MILMLVGKGTDENPRMINPNPFDVKGKSDEVLVSCNSYGPVWQDITACPGVRAASAASERPNVARNSIDNTWSNLRSGFANSFRHALPEPTMPWLNMPV
jgi:hypothetical protein